MVQTNRYGHQGKQDDILKVKDFADYFVCYCWSDLWGRQIYLVRIIWSWNNLEGGQVNGHICDACCHNDLQAKVWAISIEKVWFGDVELWKGVLFAYFFRYFLPFRSYVFEKVIRCWWPLVCSPSFFDLLLPFLLGKSMQNSWIKLIGFHKWRIIILVNIDEWGNAII